MDCRAKAVEVKKRKIEDITTKKTKNSYKNFHPPRSAGNIASANSIIEVSTFEELKEACNSNATITLLNDIICTEPITFEANRTIII